MTLTVQTGLHQLDAGDILYQAGHSGAAWTLVEGSLRLDRPSADAASDAFAGLAVKGDILGAETLLLGQYSFTATALTPCLLAEWPGNAHALDPTTLLTALTRAERRGAEAIALRCGEASLRVRRLLSLIAQSLPGRRLSRPALPSLRDMADITALTIGTVSRTLGTLQTEGLLSGADVRRGRPRIAPPV